MDPSLHEAATLLSADAQPPFPIDAVFTWVDGSDPVWLESKRALRRKLFGDRSVTDDADNLARFHDNDELRYAFRSFARHAPWIRTIYLVTANQKPSWLNTDNVKLVGHKDIFPEDVSLPVFSTRPIEFCVHRIPDLAEHFVYANDDFMLGRDVSWRDFFLPDGRVLLWVLKRGPKYMDKLFSKLGSPSSHTSAVARAHNLIRSRYGNTYPYVVRHYPKSMTRSSAAALWEAFPEEIRCTLNAPFRSSGDVSVTMLYPLFLLAEEQGDAKILNSARQICEVLHGRGVAHIGASIGDNNAKMKMQGIRVFRPRTFCLNDSPSASAKDRAQLKAFLEEMFPTPCRYEMPEGG